MRAKGIATAAAVLCLTLAGCGGGGAEVKTTTTTVSLGQQLIDLQQALDKGAVSQSEYARLKRDIIKNAQ